MIVAPGISMVASGALGFDLTDPWDCTVWMIDSGTGGHVLFDAGAGRDSDAVLAQAAADGVAASDIRTVLMTHAHADHSGGLAPLRARLGCRILAGAATATLLTGDETGVSLDRARVAGFYPADYVWQPAPADEIFADGDILSIGRLRIHVIATPGHCADHTSFLVEDGARRILITGDAVFYGGKVSLQDLPDCSVSQSCQSIRRLAQLDFDMFLPAHGVFTLRGGKRHVERAKAIVDGLLPPGSLFS